MKNSAVLVASLSAAVAVQDAAAWGNYGSGMFGGWNNNNNKLWNHNNGYGWNNWGNQWNNHGSNQWGSAGSWYNNDDVSSEAYSVLMRALQTNQNFNYGGMDGGGKGGKGGGYINGGSGFCVREVDGVEQQVVSGMNYVFHVEGCITNQPTGNGRCYNNGGEMNCGQYRIQVFAQPWTNIYQIQNIQRD